MSYPAALRCLILLVAACGILEFFWIQIVYNRFPILKEDEIRRGRGEIRLNEAEDEGSCSARG